MEVTLHPTMLAAVLADLADNAGMSPRGFVASPDRLTAVGLDPTLITEGVVQRACGLFRKAVDVVMARVPTPAIVAGPTATEDAEVLAIPTLAPAEKRQVTRCQVFGYSITAVIRRLGKEGWDFENTWLFCGDMRVGADKLSKTTVRIQLKAGKDGTRGEPAPLTAAQLRWCQEVTN